MQDTSSTLTIFTELLIAFGAGQLSADEIRRFNRLALDAKLLFSEIKSRKRQVSIR